MHAPCGRSHFVVWSPLWPRMHHSASYGFGHLIIHNTSHLYWEQLLNEGQGGKDTLWIVKRHNPGQK